MLQWFVTFPQGHLTLTFLQSFVKQFLTHFTHSLILKLELLSIWSQHATIGQRLTRMWGDGHDLVFNVSDPKYKDTASPLSTLATPDTRFDLVHVDIVGPSPPSKGYTYLSTSIDHFTRWPEAVPIADISVDTVAQAFVCTWISRFRVPSTIPTDRGRQFESHFWQQLMQLLGSKRIEKDCLSPYRQRYSWKIPPPIEGRTESYYWPHQLGWHVTYDITWNSHKS